MVKLIIQYIMFTGLILIFPLPCKFVWPNTERPTLATKQAYTDPTHIKYIGYEQTCFLSGFLDKKTKTDAPLGLLYHEVYYRQFYFHDR